jgi:hypothetical protein
MIKKGNLNRREFLNRTLSCAAPLVLLGISNQVFPFSKQEITDSNHEKQIIYRTLGKTGIKLPVVNMGVMNTLDPA